MKLLKSLATDLVANSARFIYLDSAPSGGERADEITKENAKNYLKEDTHERLDALGYSAKALTAAKEANNAVATKLPEFWTKLQNNGTPLTKAEMHKLAGEYLVADGAAMPDVETQRMYRTEMFATFRDALVQTNYRATLPNMTNEGVSDLLLDGMAQVFTYKKEAQTAHESLWSASRMMKYDEDHEGVNVKEWTKDGSIMRYEEEMAGSEKTGKVDAGGNLTVGDKVYKIQGAEILTGAAMMDYPAEYLSKFEFRNVIERDGRLMACVDNGCHGNLAVFKVEKTGIVVPSNEEEEEEEEEEKTDECNLDDVVDPEACNDGGTIVEKWNGIDLSLPENEGLLCEMSCQTVEHVKDAREVYIGLYGKEKWNKDKDRPEGMETIEKDGVYVVLEKHFNKKMGIPLLEAIAEMTGTDRKLVESFEKAGYSETEAQKIAEVFEGSSKEMKIISGNIKKLEGTANGRSSGAGLDFLKKVGMGAAIAAPLALALGVPITTPLLLAGMPLVHFRKGGKQFDAIPGPDQIYSLLSQENLTDDDCANLLESFTNNGVTYNEVQRNAVATTEVFTNVAYDHLDDNSALIRLNENAILTAEQQVEYEKFDVRAENVASDTEVVLNELEKSIFAFESGAEDEGAQTAKVKSFKLEKSKILGGGVEVDDGDNVRKKGERKAFKMNMQLAREATTSAEKQKYYDAAMGVLVDEVNETAKKKLDESWSDNPLTLNKLAESYEHGGVYKLGELPTKGDGANRELQVKYVPFAGREAVNGVSDGTWELFVLQDGKIQGETIPYRDAMDLTDVEMTKLVGNGDLSGREKRAIQKKTQYFDGVVGHMAQLNGLSDKMNLVVLNEAQDDRLNDLQDIIEVGALEATPAKRRARIAVASKLARFGTYEDFVQKSVLYGKYGFTPDVLVKIKDVYDKKDGAMDALLVDKKFRLQMSELTLQAECVANYTDLTDLEECARYSKEQMYFSNKEGMVSPLKQTITFGEVYGAYMIAEGLLTPKMVETIQNVKTEGGAQMTETEVASAWDDLFGTLAPEVQTEITKNTVRGMQLKRGIIALTAGLVTAQVIDARSNRLNR